MNQKIDILLASPRGFCAGVVRAIETVNITLEKVEKPVYVLHEIVHNKHVISELEEKGARFVVDLTEVPRGEICIFSAHGVSVETELLAEKLGLKTVDATCPLVNSIHRMVEQYYKKGFEVVIIGHHGHPEVVGTAGRVKNGAHVVATPEEVENLHILDPEKVAYVTQTTLSQKDSSDVLDVLKDRFPSIKGPKQSNICYATQNRQNAVRYLAENSELIFVVGSKNSSNSNRLREVAEQSGGKSYLIDDFSDIRNEWLSGVKKVGITAGASAPERLVEGVIEWLNDNYSVGRISKMKGIAENISFKPAVLTM